jgi:hypothetical protein
MVPCINSSTPLVMVVTAEGNFYHYSLNLQEGGECVLLNRYRYGYTCAQDLRGGSFCYFLELLLMARRFKLQTECSLQDSVEGKEDADMADDL